MFSYSIITNVHFIKKKLIGLIILTRARNHEEIYLFDPKCTFEVEDSQT